MTTDIPSTQPLSDPPPNQPSGPSVAYPSLDQLAPTIPPVTWLWPGWIPRGMITLLCAAPGAGKSYFALDLARRLIANLPWPDNTGPAQAGTSTGPALAGTSTASTGPALAGTSTSSTTPTVIYVDAEAAPQLLNARALAWGMDRTHLYPMLAEEDQALDLNAPSCQARLTAMVVALHPALVIVDSLGSAARGAENHVHAVDALFGFLNRLAVRNQCAVLLIHHLRKRAEGNGAGSFLSGDDVRGSGHIVSLARSVLGLASIQIGLDPQPGATRRLQLLKTNLGPRPDPLGVNFIPAAEGCAGLSYAPAPRPARSPTQVESCARWLLDILTIARRPAKPSELEPYAYEEGFSRATLFRARELLGDRIINTRGPYDPYTYWTVPPWPRPEPPAEPETKPQKGRRTGRS